MSIALHRRRILGLAAAGLATAALPLPAQQGDRRTRVVLRYRTRPENVARLAPPPLTPADEPVVEFELDWIEPARPDLLAPKPYGLARFFVAVRHGDRQGRLPIGVYASNDRARLAEREGRGLPAEDAEIDARFGEQSSITIRRRGETLFEMTAGFGDEAGRYEGSAPVFAPVFTLDQDWQGSVVRASEAELWEIPSAGPAPAVSAIAPASVRTPYASPGDPLAELPVEEVLGAWSLLGAPEPAAPKKIADLDAATLAAWAPLRYDRPVERERYWTPPGWREETSAFRFTEDEIARYRSRKEILLDPLEIVEIDAMISQEAHAALIPPLCRAAGRPMIKLFGIRVGASALSPVPYCEVWLFAFTLTANRLAWYAVSHIVGEGGDLTFGRDVFGYPSKAGEPDIVVTPVDFSLSVKRMGREIAYADGPFHGFSTGTSLAQLPMVGLRAKPGGRGAELVYQLWTFQGRRNRVDPGGFQMGFPAAAAPGLELKPDPWYQLGVLQPAMLSVMENGVMQRNPGEVVAELPELEDFYRERCDGVLPWEPRPAVLTQPSLLARRPAGASS